MKSICSAFYFVFIAICCGLLLFLLRLDYDPYALKPLAYEYNRLVYELDSVEQIDTVVFQKKQILEKINQKFGGKHREINNWIIRDIEILNETNPIQKSIKFGVNKTIHHKDLYFWYNAIVIALTWIIVWSGAVFAYSLI